MSTVKTLKRPHKLLNETHWTNYKALSTTSRLVHDRLIALIESDQYTTEEYKDLRVAQDLLADLTLRALKKA